METYKSPLIYVSSLDSDPVTEKVTAGKCHSFPQDFAAEIWLIGGSPCVQSNSEHPSSASGRIKFLWSWWGSGSAGSLGNWELGRVGQKRELELVLVSRMSKIGDKEWPGHFYRCG